MSRKPTFLVASSAVPPVPRGWAASWNWPVWYSIPPREVLAPPTEAVLGTRTSNSSTDCTPTVPVGVSPWPRFARPARRVPLQGPFLFPPPPRPKSLTRPPHCWRPTTTLPLALYSYTSTHSLLLFPSPTPPSLSPSNPPFLFSLASQISQLSFVFSLAVR
jgi:hypothetical protein